MPNYIVSDGGNGNFSVRRDRILQHNADKSFIEDLPQGKYFVVAGSKNEAIRKVRKYVEKKEKDKVITKEEKEKVRKLVFGAIK